MTKHLVRLAVCLAVALSLTAVTMPANAAQRIDNRYFGVVDGDSSTVETYPRTNVGAISYMGSSYWRQLQNDEGAWVDSEWQKLDQKVALATKKRARPLLVLGSTPKFASTEPGSATPWSTMPKLTPFKAYVRKVFRRYGARVDYQLWPEPNIVTNWSGTPRQMATLQKVAWQEKQKIAPKARLGGPATVLRLKGQQRWARNFYSQKFSGKSVIRYVDFVALDPYPVKSGTPETSMQLVELGRRIVRQETGTTRPIWSVEINYNVAGGGETTGPLPQAKQISYVIRTYALSAAHRVQRVYWLGWGSYQTMGVSLTQADNVTPSAAGQAYARARSWMVKFTNRRCVRDRTKVWTCTLTGRAGGRAETRQIIWRVGGTSYRRAPKGTFRLSTGTGGSKAFRGGKRFKVTQMPVMLRIRG